MVVVVVGALVVIPGVVDELLVEVDAVVPNVNGLLVTIGVDPLSSFFSVVVVDAPNEKVGAELLVVAAVVVVVVVGALEVVVEVVEVGVPNVRLGAGLLVLAVAPKLKTGAADDVAVVAAVVAVVVVVALVVDVEVPNVKPVVAGVVLDFEVEPRPPNVKGLLLVVVAGAVTAVDAVPVVDAACET